jgi:hypothetical protein
VWYYGVFGVKRLILILWKDHLFFGISWDILKHNKANVISNNSRKDPLKLFSLIKNNQAYTVVSDEIYLFISGMESSTENSPLRKK